MKESKKNGRRNFFERQTTFGERSAFGPSGSDLGVSARSNAELTVEASSRGVEPEKFLAGL